VQLVYLTKAWNLIAIVKKIVIHSPGKY